MPFALWERDTAVLHLPTIILPPLRFAVRSCGRRTGLLGRCEKTPLFKRRSRGRPSDQAIQQGPTWRRIDLHLHTPGSSDYQEPRATYLDVLQKAEARGLDII